MKKLLLIFLLSSFLFITFSGAECNIKGLVGKDPKEFTKEDVSAGVTRFIDIMAAAASTIAIIYIVYGGIQYMTSVGKEQGQTTAKSTLTWAVVGFILIICSWGLIHFFIGKITEGKSTNSFQSTKIDETSETAFFDDGAEWTYCEAGNDSGDANNAGFFENLFVSADEKSNKTSCVNLTYPDKIADEKKMIGCLDKTIKKIQPTSPLKAVDFNEAAKTYNINPALLIAMVNYESGLGTAFDYTKADPKHGGKYNFGHIERTGYDSNNPVPPRFANYNSYQEGLTAMTKLLRNVYMTPIKEASGYKPLTTIKAILTEYAPSPENNTAAYIKYVEQATNDISKKCNAQSISPKKVSTEDTFWSNDYKPQIDF